VKQKHNKKDKQTKDARLSLICVFVFPWQGFTIASRFTLLHPAGPVVPTVTFPANMPCLALHPALVKAFKTPCYG
jgi:hypothetical protein